MKDTLKTLAISVPLSTAVSLAIWMLFAWAATGDPFTGCVLCAIAEAP